MDQTRLNFLISNKKPYNNVISNCNFKNLNIKNSELNLNSNQRIITNNFSKINFLIFNYYNNLDINLKSNLNKNNIKLRIKKKKFKKLNSKEILYNNKSINLIYF